MIAEGSDRFFIGKGRLYMNESKQQEILLESGINELEIMEFTIGSQLFGINVAKVREIMKVEPLVHIQKSNEYIEGIFKPRDKVLTVINLPGFSDLRRPKSQSGIYLLLPASTTANMLSMCIPLSESIGFPALR